MLHRHIRPAFCLLLAAAAPACGPTGAQTPEAGTSTCGADTRGMVYAPGMKQHGAAGVFDVQLVLSQPGPPVKGDNAWTVKVTDPASGAAVDGLSLSVVPFMPDHGHGTPITVKINPMSGGTYGLAPLNLFMAGLWQVPVDAVMPTNKAQADIATFYFCIEG